MATTKQAQHTRGPWRVDRDDSGLFIRMEPLGDLDQYLAVYASPDEEQREADAALIAAAPDLLAACEAALRALEHNRQRGLENMTPLAYEVEIDTLREAIAKAKGG